VSPQPIAGFPRRKIAVDFDQATTSRRAIISVRVDWEYATAQNHANCRQKFDQGLKERFSLRDPQDVDVINNTDVVSAGIGAQIIRDKGGKFGGRVARGTRQQSMPGTCPQAS
jgi:hypothetical protein